MWPFPSGVEPKLIVDRIVSLGALCEVAYQARRLSKSSRALSFRLVGHASSRRSEGPGDWLGRGLFRTAYRPSCRERPARFPPSIPASPARFISTKFLETGMSSPWTRSRSRDGSFRNTRRCTRDSSPIVRPARPCSSGSANPSTTPKARRSSMIDALHEALSAFAPDCRLLFVDHAPVAARPWLIQAQVQRHADWTDLGSNRGWDEMFQSLGILAGGSEDHFRFDDLRRPLPGPPLCWRVSANPGSDGRPSSVGAPSATIRRPYSQLPQDTENSREFGAGDRDRTDDIQQEAVVGS